MGLNMGKLMVVVLQVLSFLIRLSRLGRYPRQRQLFGKYSLRLSWMMKVALAGYVETLIFIFMLTSKICTCVWGEEGNFALSDHDHRCDVGTLRHFFSEQNLIEQWNVIMDITSTKPSKCSCVPTFNDKLFALKVESVELMWPLSLQSTFLTEGRAAAPHVFLKLEKTRIHSAVSCV